MRKILIFLALLVLTMAIVFLIPQVRTPRGLVQNVSDKNHVYILLGGMRSWDGVITSAGMYGLKSELLTSFPNTNVKTYTWSSYSDAANEINGLPKDDVVIVIGYSGGGSRATWLANMAFHPKIDLMVLYDPSPKWQMKSIPVNVKHSVCYHNLRGALLGLGGGVCRGVGIETVDINENHLAVQLNESLHQRTIEEVRRVSRPPLRGGVPEAGAPTSNRLWPIGAALDFFDGLFRHGGNSP